MFGVISNLVKSIELGLLLTRLDKQGKILSVSLEQDKLKIVVKTDKISNEELQKLMDFGFTIEN
jgi:hypothetical protein